MSNRDANHHGAVRRVIEADAAGCRESRLLLTRRAMLGMTASLFTLPLLPDDAEAATDADRRLMIVLLRGGLDGLHVAFHKDEKATLAGYRGRMFDAHEKSSGSTVPYLDRYAALAGSGFLLNPAMPKFAQMFNQGQAAIVHAIAPPLRNRSHFDCMYNLESGQPGLNTTRDGWLNRCIAGLSSRLPASRALSLRGGPLILQGSAGFDSWGGRVFEDFGDAYADALVRSYAEAGLARDTTGLFRQLGAELRRGLDTNKLALEGDAQRGSGLVSTFRGAAALMSQLKGPRIAVVAIDGMDTHDRQIQLLDKQLATLDAALDAFKARMGNNWSNTIVACVSEFGRTVRVNAAGTDHGVGTVALLAGGNLNARVAGDWPGLKDLDESRDLKAANDIRALFKGLLMDHLGIRNRDFLDKIVFPESRSVKPMTGLVRTLAGNADLNPSTLDQLKVRA